MGRRRKKKGEEKESASGEIKTRVGPTGTPNKTRKDETEKYIAERKINEMLLSFRIS